MRTVIFSNGAVGPADFYLRAIKSDDYLICADGGANAALALELLPDLVVGDMDSINPSVRLELSSRGKTEFRAAPSRKDESDTELAIRAALERNPAEMLLTAVLGGRIDHSLTNIHLLELVPEEVSCSIEEPDVSIRLVRRRLILEGRQGSTVSVLAVGGDAGGVSLEGFEYPLRGASIRQASSLGLSNVVRDQTAVVNVSDGMLLVLCQASPDAGK